MFPLLVGEDVLVCQSQIWLPSPKAVLNKVAKARDVLRLYERRLRGDLPTGPLGADKTGFGDRNPVTHATKATNDVGIITLPSGRGHLAIAVLVSESKIA